MTRSQFLKSLAAVSLLPKVSSAQEPAPDLRKAFIDGMATLNDQFWVPELANWLDRPGKDLLSALIALAAAV